MAADQKDMQTYVDGQGLESKLGDALNTVLLERPPDAVRRLSDLLAESVTQTVTKSEPWRPLSLPKQVAKAGGVAAWNNSHPELRQLKRMLVGMCAATTVEGALEEVRALVSMGHNLWSYAYMRTLYNKAPDLYYGALLASPSELLPVVYTPTVGEACQKFGKMPFYRRGCYVSINNRGNIKKVCVRWCHA